ncbi:inhibitor of Bruton tyrosine kinase-like [Acanthaster planci]|uniref:Inhibitor of Bruton tyrosine kinase-like n=1 Tax=Acanthaster planci TaxID=133434 RepID=A0A8B7Y985_ACAPL|nr:inhibitor of Bruton tyrosine kinase-like [Acanthaster planci]XP_022089804.1 inhibitor of Bruton tyrosine kinase-like [Acanthaster planci]
MNPMLEADCTLRCRSSRCASNLISVITRGTPHQIKTYLGGACQNAGHVADACGRTTLHMAASLGKFEIIDWLVKEKHASLGAEDLESGWTALHRSIFHGQVIAAVYLISHGASTDKHDNEDLTPLEIAMKDHPGYAEYDPRGPSQVYSWGSNANFTLGHGGGKSRSQPDVVDRFARDGLSIKQVVMCKFHTVFLTHQGAVYTCGHGQGGRLGHGNEEVCLRPHPVTTLTGKVCEFVAAARDHTLFLMEDGTVFSCGQNSQHQLGHSSLGVKALTPKLIFSKQIKHKTMLGIAAGRFHSVMHTKEAVYTFGLNAGQLGHAKGEKYVVSPCHVTTLHHDKVELTHVTTSDAATVCATKAGDIYVLNEYQCRKVASKQLNLLKIVASGGTLDSDLSDGTLQKKGGSELVLLVLNQSGQVHNWRSSSRALRRCAWTRKRQVFMADVALSRQGVLFCTEEGEAFSGRFLGKKSSSSSHGKDSSQASPRASRDNVHSRDWPEDPEEMDRVSLNRVPAVHRAVRVACSPNGLDFAVLQADPKASLTEVPSVSPSLMVKHLSHLLTDADLSDCIHDVVLKVGHRSIPAHKYILTLRSDYFRCLFLQTSPRENHNSAHTPDAFDSFPVVKPRETHDVTDKTDFHTLMQLLQYIYTDTCDVFQSDFDFKSVPGTPRSPTTGLDVADDFDKLTITKENRHKSAYGVYKEHNEKKGNKEGGKKAKKDGGAKKNEADGMVYVRSLIDAAKKFGVASLVKRLDQVKFRDGRLWNFRPSAKPLHFHPRQLPQLANVVLCSEEGTLFPCHKCLLVARLEYFQSMLGSGWIEASSSDPLKMPLPASILSILLEYIYTDDAPSVRAATDVELLCNMLATADQLLISRLKEMCEVALVDLISLRNVAELLQFASVYRANQLKRTCHQYIGLNLACLLESRALEILSSDVLLELTEAYKEMIPSMPYRIITPYEEGPDISYIEEEPSTESSHSTSAEVMEGHTISFDRGDFDQIIRKAKAKRKASRRTSTGKRKSLSFSESGENNASSNQLPDVIPRTLPMEMDNLTIATDAIGDAGQGDSSTSASSVSSPTGQPKVDEAKERGRWEQEASRDSGNSEPESIPANPGNHNVSPSGVQSPPGKWIRKGWSETAVDEKTKRSLGTPEKAFGKDETQSKGWKSPSMLDITGPDLRSIMQSQASLTAASKKPLTTSRMTTPIAKKSQKQRKREQERAADSATSPPPTSPVEHPTPTCPWGGARKMAPASTSSFREVQMEEQKRIMGSTAVSTATSPPAKSRGLEQLSFGIVSRARRVSNNEPSMLVEAPPQKASPREVPENPWQHRATSPPAARVSFSEIIKLETEQRETLAKTLKKPFSLIQIEEKAIEELWAYYHTEDRVDEFVTVERATNVAATPLWRKGKDGS